VVAGRRLSSEAEGRIIRLASRGWSYREIQAELRCSAGPVCRVLKTFDWKVPPKSWDPSPARLSLEERVEICLGVRAGRSFRAIAAGVGRAPSTVSREVNHNGGRAGYEPVAAHEAAGRRARRPKVVKLEANRRLCDRVVHDLERLWSPQQITRRLREDFPDQPEMWVSHETIYQSLYVQGRGALRKELAACLRTGRARRCPRGRTDQRGQIPDMVMISERPADVADRAVPGHWEGDLIMGANNASAIGTLVERSTRFVMLLHLPDGRTADKVRDAMTQAIQTLPAALRRSITWDQGKEMAQHAQFTIDTGVQIYFCDPHSPWQRGSNENTNGLLRQYFPKGTSLKNVTPEQLQAAADSLNGRPRQTLNWRTPSERLNEALGATTG